MSAIPKSVATVLVAAAVACSSSNGGGNGPDGSGGGTGASGSAGSGGASGRGGQDGPPAGNAIMGNIAGKPFSTVGTALWIGAPDAPATTTVIYLFEMPIACADISAHGWDANHGDTNQVMELKLGGDTLTTYAARPPNPMGTVAANEAAVNHTFLSVTATPTEVGAMSGTVTLASATAGTNATGSFDLTFQMGVGTLKGTFDATWCPTGVEP